MRIATLLLSLAIAASASAQGRNVAYFELGGNAIVPSVNYERQLSERLFGRIGLTLVSGTHSDGDTELTFGFPVMLNYVSHPAGRHHFEAGAGFTYITGDAQDLFGEDDESISNFVGTATIGYRYQKPGRGLVFRAGFTPVFDESEAFPWGGLSLGYRW